MKKWNIVGISLFSAMLFGGIDYTQVKAEDFQNNNAVSDSDVQNSTTKASQLDSTDDSNGGTTTPDSDPINVQNDTQNNDSQSEPSVQNNVNTQDDVQNNSPDETDPDEQQVNVYLKNQNGNIVKDVYGNPICLFSGVKKVGDQLNSDDYNFSGDKIMYDDLYNQSLSVQKNISDYYFNVVSKMALINAVSYSNGKFLEATEVHSTSLENSDPPGRKVYAGDTFNIKEVSKNVNHFYRLNGQKPSKILVGYNNGSSQVELQNAPDDITVSSYYNYYLSVNSDIFDFLVYLYFEEPVPVMYQDTDGNSIGNFEGKNKAIINDDGKGNIIHPDYDKYVKPIDGYTFQKDASSYVMKWNNDGSVNTDVSRVVMVYSKDDETYPIVNYVGSDGKVVYSMTSYDSNLTPDKVADISSQGDGKFNDLQNMKIIKTNTGYNVLVSDKGVLYRIIQKIGDLVIADESTYMSPQNGIYQIVSKATNDKYTINTDESTYNIINLESSDLNYYSTLYGEGYTSANVSDLIKVLNAGIYDGFVENNLHTEFVVTAIYNEKPTQVKINYLDDNGNKVSSSMEAAPKTDNTSIDQIIQLPSGYKMSGLPAGVDATSDAETLVLNVTVNKDSTGDTHSGGGGSSSHHNSGGDTSDVVKINQKLSIKNKNVTIVNSSGKTLSRSLSEYSNWVTDKRMNIGGEVYYRVGSDEWVNEKDIYLYTDNMSQVYTYSDSYKLLTHHNGKMVNRALQARTDWLTDRYAYFDGQKYYRVATNEWVKDSDVLEYQPVTTVVNTSGTTIYDERGNRIRTLSAGAYKIDRVATINNVKMYRVAANEWIQVN